MPTAKTRAKKRTTKTQVYVNLLAFDAPSPMVATRREDPAWFRIKHRDLPLDKVLPLEPGDYSQNGGTPLLDAVAEMVDILDQASRKKPDDVHIGVVSDESGSMYGNEQSVAEGYNEFTGGLQGIVPDSGGKVMLVVMTDGFENSSVKMTSETLKALIKERENQGWAFIYLGANQDAWQGGGAVGMGARGQAYATSSSPQGVRSSFRRAGAATAHYIKEGAVAYRSMASILPHEVAEDENSLDVVAKAAADAGKRLPEPSTPAPQIRTSQKPRSPYSATSQAMDAAKRTLKKDE